MTLDNIAIYDKNHDLTNQCFRINVHIYQNSKDLDLFKLHHTSCTMHTNLHCERKWRLDHICLYDGDALILRRWL